MAEVDIFIPIYLLSLWLMEQFKDKKFVALFTKLRERIISTIEKMRKIGPGSDQFQKRNTLSSRREGYT